MEFVSYVVVINGVTSFCMTFNFLEVLHVMKMTRGILILDENGGNPIS
jgi:hypothetical protein